jgi:hypothetical protein
VALILIASTRKNNLAANVSRILQAKSHDVVLLATDAIANQKEKFSVFITPDTRSLTYQNREIPLESIDAAWYWHAEISFDQTRASRSALVREMQQSFYGVFAGIDDRRWINPPYSIRNTQEKLSQMFFAMDVGLNVPPNVIANHWDAVDRFGDRTIIKMPVVGILEGETPKVMHTTILSQKQRQLLKKTSPFPGIHQPYIVKKREWRITVVGDAVFPVAIYTALDAKDDWRKHQRQEGKVRFVSEPLLDKSIEEKCKALLQRLRLRYGAFDFIETPEGEMIFLEVNSVGQYGWLEDKLGLPISETIADLLVHIAKRDCESELGQ